MITFAMVPHTLYLARNYLVARELLDASQVRSLLNATYNLNVVFELGCLYSYFSSLIKKNVLIKFNAIYSLALLIGIFMFIQRGSIHDEFLSKWLVINNLIYCGSILYILFKMYSSDHPLKIEPSFFIFSIALFLYTSGTVIYFSFQDKTTALKIVHDYLNITLYILIAIGFAKEGFFDRSIRPHRYDG